MGDAWVHPHPLAADYQRFGVEQRPGEGRLLLTGHSHQAWPDVAREGHMKAFDDAAERVDTKWEAAFEQAEIVQQGFAWRLGDTDDAGERRGIYTLGSNTHELVVRFLSALPLIRRPRLVTTDGEFHSIRRQLDRLEEEGIEVVRVSSQDVGTLAERLAAAVDDRTAAVLVSFVLFQNAAIVPGLAQVATACERHGAELLVDTYHAVNVVELDLHAEGLGGAYAVGGGYKYCQLGEGNCFLRVPAQCDARPVITGWFAEFDVLAESQDAHKVAYGQGANRFAGATYDPTSHYRGAAVFDFFRRKGLTPSELRRISQHQVGFLAQGFDDLDLDPEVVRRPSLDLDQIGGFLAVISPRAEQLSTALRQRHVWTDFRGDVLRFGPAPYLSDRQLQDGLEALAEALADS